MLRRNNVLSQQVPMKEPFLPQRNCILQTEKKAVFPVTLIVEKNSPNTSFCDKESHLSAKKEDDFSVQKVK